MGERPHFLTYGPSIGDLRQGMKLNGGISMEIGVEGLTVEGNGVLWRHWELPGCFMRSK